VIFFSELSLRLFLFTIEKIYYQSLLVMLCTWNFHINIWNSCIFSFNIISSIGMLVQILKLQLLYSVCSFVTQNVAVHYLNRTIAQVIITMLSENDPVVYIFFLGKRTLQMAHIKPNKYMSSSTSHHNWTAKEIVKVKNRNAEGFLYLSQKFVSISNAKVK
jgi:hypothetical protein